MKIDANQPAGTAPELQQNTAADGARRAARLGYQEGAGQAAEAGPGSPTDEVSLSGLSQELARLTHANPEREAHIDRLAADYAAGKLKVDAGRVASKVIDDALTHD